MNDPRVNLTGSITASELWRGPKGDPFTYEDFTPEQLDSLKGKNGYTPEKGVDYYTEEEKDELVSEVLAAVPKCKVKTVNGVAPDEIGDVKLSIPECKVKTVNGVEPDEHGNVEIQVDGDNVITQPKLDAALTEFKNNLPEVPKQVQADCNQIDETAPDYIKNRTHGFGWLYQEVMEKTFGPSDVQPSVYLDKYGYSVLSGENKGFHLHDGAEINVYVNGELYFTKTDPPNTGTTIYTTTESGEELRYVVQSDRKTGTRNMMFYFAPFTETTTARIEYRYPGIKKLDSIYIGDDIARTADAIKTVNGNGPDETGNVVVDIPECKVQTVNNIEPDDFGNIQLPEFTEDDALELLIDTHVIEPLADVDGNIYTDANGVIYTL